MSDLHLAYGGWALMLVFAVGGAGAFWRRRWRAPTNEVR